CVIPTATTRIWMRTGRPPRRSHSSTICRERLSRAAGRRDAPPGVEFQPAIRGEERCPLVEALELCDLAIARIDPHLDAAVAAIAALDLPHAVVELDLADDHHAVEGRDIARLVDRDHGIACADSLRRERLRGDAGEGERRDSDAIAHGEPPSSTF